MKTYEVNNAIGQGDFYYLFCGIIFLSFYKTRKYLNPRKVWNLYLVFNALSMSGINALTISQDSRLKVIPFLVGSS